MSSDAAKREPDEFDLLEQVVQLKRDSGDYGRQMAGELGDLSWDQADVRVYEAADSIATLERLNDRLLNRIVDLQAELQEARREQ